MTLNFNKIFVIQSLDNKKDKPTGKLLYDEVIQYFKMRHSKIDSEFFDVQTIEEFNNVLFDIAIQCSKGVRPVIHFELHGNIFGFSLIQGRLDWGEVYKALILVNIESKFNLFITTAICFSNFAMALLLPTLPAPFKGLLGSFEKMYDNDIYIQYNAFYTELLNTLDLDKALEEFYLSNPSISGTYKLLDAEDVFKNIYQKYLNDTGSINILRNRYDEGMKRKGTNITSSNNETMFSKFVILIQNTQRETFIKNRDTFFMYDNIPENRLKYCVNWEPNYFKYF